MMVKQCCRRISKLQSRARYKVPMSRAAAVLRFWSFTRLPSRASPRRPSTDANPQPVIVCATSVPPLPDHCRPGSHCWRAFLRFAPEQVKAVCTWPAGNGPVHSPRSQRPRLPGPAPASRRRVAGFRCRKSRKTASRRPEGADRSAEFWLFQTQWLPHSSSCLRTGCRARTCILLQYDVWPEPGHAVCDWLQSSAVSAPSGLYVDRPDGGWAASPSACWVVINVLEHYNNWYVLAVGRVLGGISTSLLFTAFESWSASTASAAQRRTSPRPLRSPRSATAYALCLQACWRSCRRTGG